MSLGVIGDTEQIDSYPHKIIQIQAVAAREVRRGRRCRCCRRCRRGRRIRGEREREREKLLKEKNRERRRIGRKRDLIYKRKVESVKIS